MPQKKRAAASQPDAESIEKENVVTMERLAEMREEIASLKLQETADIATVQAAIHAAQLAEEERRLQVELDYQRTRVGVVNIAETAPELSHEVDARLVAEAEAADAELLAAAQASAESGGTSGEGN